MTFSGPTDNKYSGTAHATISTAFARLVGFESVTVTKKSTARIGSGTVDCITTLGSGTVSGTTATFELPVHADAKELARSV